MVVVKVKILNVCNILQECSPHTKLIRERILVHSLLVLYSHKINASLKVIIYRYTYMCMYACIVSSCSILLSASVINSTTKSSLERKWFIHLTSDSPSQGKTRSVTHGGKLSHKPQRSVAYLLANFVLLSNLLIQSRPTNLGMVVPTVDQTLLYQLTIKKIPYIIGCRPT